MPKYKHWLRICVLTVVALVSTVAPVAAATEGQASDLQSVAQSYTTASPLQQGVIVQLTDSNKNAVQAVDYKNSKKTFGVVVSASSAPVTLSTEGGANLVYVVTSGRFNVLVSNQNGEIKSGDYIAASAVAGIGMHADTKQDTILGRAATSFDGKSNVISRTDLKTADDKTLKVTIGSVSVDVGVVPNPLKSNSEDGVPNFVQNISRTLVGQSISAVQLYASLAILLTGIGVVASLLYGGVQTGMTAIGRNPLAKQSIVHNMLQVIITGVSIFIGCLIAVYLILKL